MTDAGKTQWIRLADVLLIGPLMIYAGSRRRLAPWIDLSLIVTGLLTIGYNADNYLQQRRQAAIATPRKDITP